MLLECCFLYKEQVLPYLIDCYLLLSYNLQGYIVVLYLNQFFSHSPITEGRKLSVISVCSVRKCFFREETLSDKQLKVVADNWLINRSFGSTFAIRQLKVMIMIRINIKQTVILNINIINILNVEQNIHIIYVIIH